MSAELNAATKALDAAEETSGRKLEYQFRDLCKAVRKIIEHLQKLEKSSKE